MGVWEWGSRQRVSNNSTNLQVLSNLGQCYLATEEFQEAGNTWKTHRDSYIERIHEIAGTIWEIII